LPARSFSSCHDVEDRTVLVVDDVLTTGTTLRRAATTLLAAEARAVYCAALTVAPDARRLS
jgi:predicted amidophosphoribosyltransferase